MGSAPTSRCATVRKRLVPRKRWRLYSAVGHRLLGKKERALKLVVSFLLCLASVAHASSQNTPAARLGAAATVLEEIMQAPDKSIPQDLLDHAHAIVIVPGLKKGAFIVGGKYGKGFILCRGKEGTGWAAPGAVRIEGASIGFQLGGSESDVILLV